MKHYVSGRELFSDYPDNSEQIILGAGCFWGVEKLFWQLDGVWVTYVSYSGGQKDDPSYEEVCSGVTGHAETVHVIFNSEIIYTDKILKAFWECHDPTQGMRQGNDIGEQYRSTIYCTSQSQLELANRSKEVFQQTLDHAGFGKITTEIDLIKKSFPAEEYHQQYLGKNPNGYCNMQGTGCFL